MTTALLKLLKHGRGPSLRATRRPGSPPSLTPSPSCADSTITASILVLKDLIQSQPADSPTTQTASDLVTRLASKLEDIRSPSARACVIGLVGEHPGQGGLVGLEVLRIGVKCFEQEVSALPSLPSAKGLGADRRTRFPDPPATGGQAGAADARHQAVCAADAAGAAGAAAARAASVPAGPVRRLVRRPRPGALPARARPRPARRADLGGGRRRGRLARRRRRRPPARADQPRARRQPDAGRRGRLEAA